MRKPSKKSPFRVVTNTERYCRACGQGEMFDIEGPDGVATGTSYHDRVDAEETARELNWAYNLGKKQGASGK